MFTAHGKLIYDPHAEDATRKGRMSWWLKLDVDNSIIRYYQHWVRKEVGAHLNTPLWQAHVSVIRGETPLNKSAWKRHENSWVTFEYDVDLQMNDTYCWLRVRSEQLEMVRRELGLAPRPRVPFHLTVGNFKNTVPLKEKQKPTVVFPWETPYLP